jgi:hypothetical protein
MCATFIKTLSSQQLPMHKFPASDLVCYNYYSGRVFVFEEKYKEARIRR